MNLFSAATLLELKSTRRYSSGYSELDVHLGGGLAYGSVVHISGPPGSGVDSLVAEFIRSAISTGDHVLQYSCVHSYTRNFALVLCTCPAIQGSCTPNLCALSCHDLPNVQTLDVSSFTELLLALKGIKKSLHEKVSHLATSCFFTTFNAQQTRLLVVDGLGIIFESLPGGAFRKRLLKRFLQSITILSSQHQLCVRSTQYYFLYLKR